MYERVKPKSTDLLMFFTLQTFFAGHPIKSVAKHWSIFSIASGNLPRFHYNSSLLIYHLFATIWIRKYEVSRLFRLNLVPHFFDLKFRFVERVNAGL